MPQKRNCARAPLPYRGPYRQRRRSMPVRCLRDMSNSPMVASTTSPVPWPKVSSTRLKWSRSSNRLGACADLAWQAVHGRCDDSHPHGLRRQTAGRHTHDPVRHRPLRHDDGRPRRAQDGALGASRRRWRWSEQCNSTCHRRTGGDDGIQDAAGGRGSQAPIIRRRRALSASVALGIFGHVCEPRLNARRSPRRRATQGRTP